MIRFTLLLACLLISSSVFAQGGPRNGQGNGPRNGQGMGRGPGFGRGPAMGPGRAGGMGHGTDDRHAADADTFHFLLENHADITRTVKELDNGVETLTESDKPEVADKIKEHVVWMQHRIENTQPIRMRDPLFAELFQHTEKIQMAHEDTDKGVRVTETSDDPYVAKLIQAHAKVVTGFVERGFAEAMKNHAVPDKTSEAKIGSSKIKTYPVITNHGGVVRLPDAAQQPRSGTKILVDLTSGGDADRVNSGLEKVAKYLNIYAGAGAEPSDVQIAVVLHGDATLTVLNSDAYSAKFSTVGNPNFELLKQLHEADVEFFVCGQSLISTGASTDEVIVFVETAVSALTTVVNLQADGYAYVPLGK